jgi:nicotinamidase-related amidase
MNLLASAEASIFAPDSHPSPAVQYTVIPKEPQMPSDTGSVELALDPHEIARRPLDPAQCALIVVDIQEKLLPAIANKEMLVKNAQLLIRLAGLIGLPTLVSTQYKRGLGGTVPEIALLLQDAIALDKTEFGCFNNSGFCSAVKTLPGNRTTILLCGMETHICVMQTALGAMNQGFLVHVASDAVGSRSEWNYHIGLNRMQDAGAVISSTEMMMYELLRSSSSPTFKELLPYLKG